MATYQHLRVCFIIYSLEMGGTEVYLLRFLRAQQARKKQDQFKITIISKSGNGGALKSQFIKLDVELKFLKISYTNLFAITRFKKCLNNEFDVVCDLTGNFAGLPLFLSYISGIPKRIAFYRAGSDHFKSDFLRSTYNLVMNLLVRGFSTHILSNTKAALDNYFPNTPKGVEVHVIKNGVQSEIFTKPREKQKLRVKYGLPKDIFIIGHLGRHSPSKNLKGFLQIAEALLLENKNLHFVLCGRGTDQEDWINQLADKTKIKNFSFLGQQSRPEEILATYDLFLFPSKTEGQPNALIEAMISGLPFVASDISSIREAIPKNLTDQLFKPGDITTAVKLIIAHIKGDEELKSCQNWAIEQYNASSRFDEFYNIIVE